MKNNKTLFLFLFIFELSMFPVIRLKAQRLELSPFIGYETSSKISTNLGNLHFGNGMEIGGMFDIGLGGRRYAEIAYGFLGSYLDLEGGVNRNRLCNLSVNYFSLGFMQEIKPVENITPFGVLSLGIVNYHPTNGDIGNETKMQINFAGGAKIKISDHIGIRLQARLLMPLYNPGTFFLFGTEGKGYVVSGGIRGIQGNITSALIIRFK